uniref:Uncharacterized protein n=1 Tax=Micrurus lemniscatus lemniscatus TaxID=129467 RepID=A0A2D4J7F8_MICLE
MKVEEGVQHRDTGRRYAYIVPSRDTNEKKGGGNQPVTEVINEILFTEQEQKKLNQEERQQVQLTGGILTPKLNSTHGKGPCFQQVCLGHSEPLAGLICCITFPVTSCSFILIPT